MLDVAIAILDGKPYDKETRLKSALVTCSNATALQSEETLRQTVWLDELHAKADGYLHELDTQRLLTLALAIIVLLVTFSAAFVVVSMRRRHQLERQAFSLVVNAPERETPVTPSPLTSHPSPLTPHPSNITDVTPEEQATIEAEGDADAHFLERLRSRVQEQMGDSNFSVETLASQMGVSRVQLYRKVKTLTGRTPVDIIRLSRLNRSKVLLAQEGTTVSEVAYTVGFSSPSSFTKCFKDEFGQLPGDVRN